MNAFTNLRRAACFACCGLALLAAPSAAQTQEAAGQASQSGDQTTTGQGPLVLERVKNGFVVAPTFKVTDFDDSTGTLVGAYGGWLNDGTLFIGAGGYWLANGHDDRHLGYGGLVVGWQAGADRRIGFGARSLVGFGDATVSSEFSQNVPGHPVRPSPFGRNGMVDGGTTVMHVVRISDSFFVFEPEANVTFRLVRWLNLDCGVGYRIVGGSEIDDHVRGVSGTIAFQLGGGW